jgi:hypothetical protein
MIFSKYKVKILLKIKEFIETIVVIIRWSAAHFIKKISIIIICSIIIPMILLSITFELLSEFFRMIHDLLEHLFTVLHNLDKPFIITLFKFMGFSCGQIYLGNLFNHAGLLKLKQVAKENGIRCYVVEEMIRIEDAYYAKIIVPKETDLNLLKLIFNTNHNKV